MASADALRAMQPKFNASIIIFCTVRVFPAYGANFYSVAFFRALPFPAALRVAGFFAPAFFA